MNINFITAADILEAKSQGRMVQIKCKNCPNQGYIVRNAIGIIADHVRSGSLLHSCPICGTVTEIYPKDLAAITNILRTK